MTDRDFDANGSIIESAGSLPGERLFDSYDSEDRLTRRESSVRGVIAEYVYDGDGNRVEERTAAGTTRFLVDTQSLTGYAQVLEEKSPSNSLLRTYAFGLDLIAQHDAEAAQASATHYFGYDGLGTTRVLTDATGTVTDRFQYDAFGTLLKREGTTVTRYLFTGEQYDAALGLYYLRARWMVTGEGVFWTRDKWEGSPQQPHGSHGLIYANASPLSLTDPSGHRASLAEVEGVMGNIKTILRAVRLTLRAYDRVQTFADTINGIQGLVNLVHLAAMDGRFYGNLLTTPIPSLPNPLNFFRAAVDSLTDNSPHILQSLLMYHYDKLLKLQSKGVDGLILYVSTPFPGIAGGGGEFYRTKLKGLKAGKKPIYLSVGPSGAGGRIFGFGLLSKGSKQGVQLFRMDYHSLVGTTHLPGDKTGKGDLDFWVDRSGPHEFHYHITTGTGI